MILDDLITDRTQADVDRVLALIAKGFERMTAAEKAEFSTPMRGAYNASHLNTIIDAIDYVSERLNTIGGFQLDPTSVFYSWAVGDIPLRYRLDYILTDTEAIRSAYNTPFPQPPASVTRLGFEAANNIERILIAAEDTLERVEASFVYAGQAHSGTVWEDLQ